MQTNPAIYPPFDYNMPHAGRDHQIILMWLISGFQAATNFEKFYALPETPLDDSPNALIPDLSFESRETGEIPVVIEITRPTALQSAFNKAPAYFQSYGVQELFVFDYRNRVWFRLAPTSPAPERASFSTVLNLDLNSFLPNE